MHPVVAPIKHHFYGGQIGKSKGIATGYIKSAEQKADIFTKGQQENNSESSKVYCCVGNLFFLFVLLSNLHLLSKGVEQSQGYPLYYMIFI